MADSQIVKSFGGDDCEESERGRRGHRGHRGHDGSDGATGPTGPIGPTGPAASLAAQRTVTFADSPVTIHPTDDYFFVDTSAGPVTLNLPDPAQFAAAAKEIHIVDKAGTFDTNPATIVPFAGEMILGLAAPRALQAAWEGYTVVTDDVDWYVY